VRVRQKALFLDSFKGGSMKGHFDVKIYVLRPFLRKEISKFRAVWGKQFEKGRRKCKKEEIRKERNRKEKSTKQRRK
jgi:hypothetical protein